MSGSDEFDWEKLKAGRLDEREHDELGLVSGRGSRVAPMQMRTRALFGGRQVVQAKRDSPLAAKAGAGGSGTGRPVGLAPFHMAHSFVSRARTDSRPRSVAKGTRVPVYPRKGDVKTLRSVPGARYHDRHHCWTVPRRSAFLKTPAGRTMRSLGNAVAQMRRREGQGASKVANTTRRFQDYIERANASEARRAEEVESDRLGPISVGNLGATRAERQGFWSAVERAEKRIDSRLQCRLIGELPWWLTPEYRRQVVEGIGAEIGGRGLGWWAAAHRPDVAKGSDPRNFHLHVAYHDRPVVGREVAFEADAEGTVRAVPGGAIFDAMKDREAQGKAWVEFLKARFAAIVNAAIDAWEAETGGRAPYRYFPGSYEALGVQRTPQSHLGARRTALERVGVVTRNGLENVERSWSEQDRAFGEQQRIFRKGLDRAIGTESLVAAPSGDRTLTARRALLRNLESWMETHRGSILGCERALERAMEAGIASLTPAGDAWLASFVETAAAEGRSAGAGIARVAIREDVLAGLAGRARPDGEAALEIEARREELREWEGMDDLDEAGRRRQIVERELAGARQDFVDQARLLALRFDSLAQMRLALDLLEALAAWRSWAAAKGRPQPGEALPASIARPLEFGWARDAGSVQPVPEGLSEEDLLALRVRRRIEEAALAARLLAQAPGADRTVGIPLALPGGMALGPLAEAFEALQAPAAARFERRSRDLER